ncbi:zinc finger protein 830 [Gracilinanus agilis]|uniref:zinc finger protein 830 n=1 Tax=Gracilinanus agilis TaxID=191870 RepID=UPI001CFE46E3|nr:zinc finger protein 830 [Gracilinanus agilis]
MASPASAGKRTVKQDELRRLMKSEKQRLSASRKRVESPFAKYNRLGQLSCSLCGVAVKSELLWPTHVLGKQHKEKVAQLKGPKEPAPGPAHPPPAKRTGPEPSWDPEAKRARGGDPQASAPAASGLPADFFDSGAKEAPKEAPRKTSGLSLLPDYGDDDEEEEEEEEKKGEASEPQPPALPPSSQEAAASGLPADFFDQKTPTAPVVFHSGSIQKPEVQEKVVERRENTAEALPEGFFDDPEIDAKVRKVDAPKDQMDKEWDEFQKAMRQVNTISEAIVAEEDEEGRLDRQIGEIDEQIECYRRVEVLRDRQDVLKSKLKEVLTLRELQKKEDENNLGSDDEGELQDLLSQDWRVKGALL